MQKKIAIIGTGYVGLTTGVSLAYLGHKVICVDKDEEKLNKLRKGIVPIYEPGTEEILKSHGKNIEFSSDLKDAVSKSEVIFIAVGTPAREDGSIDLTHFWGAIKEIAESLDEYKVIVNKSTVPVGTGKQTKEEIKKYCKGDFAVVSNPEFLREGSAIKDFLEPDRVVIGTDDKKAEKIMTDIYSSIESPKLVTDINSAEMIKYASNAFLATKISFINEIGNICEKTGADVKDVSEGVGMDKRIGPKFLNAGIGYGGSCFPKDISGLISVANSHHYEFKLLNAVALVNEMQQNNFVKRIIDILAKVNGSRVGIWGLAFKPNTDDIRKSPAIKIINQLIKEGYQVQAYDPKAMENSKKELPSENIKFCSNPYVAAEGVDVLALVTDWPEFSEVDMEKVRDSMNNLYFLDGRNQFEPETITSYGFHYKGIGR